jgi:branched-chain amino acid transport system substrate-binding protein
MRTHRGVALIAASAAVALTAAACGSSSPSAGASSSASSGGSGGTYTIGVINSLTGELGAVGQQEADGMNLAVSQLNAAGGVNGKKLALDTVDDQGSVNLSTAGFKKLALQDKVPLVIGPGISATADGVAPLSDTYGVANIELISQPAVVDATTNAFEIPAPGSANAQAMVAYAKSLGIKTIALIYSNNPYGQEGLTDVKAAASAAGVQLVSSNSWDSSLFDFTAQASKAKAANPGAIFLYGAGGSSDGLLLKSVVNSGYTGKIIGDLTYSTSTIPSVAGAAADRIISLTAINYGAPDAVQKAFIDAFEAKYGSSPSVLSADGYIAVEMAAAAIKKSPTFTGKDLVKTIESLNYDSLYGPFAYTSTYHAGPGAGSFSPVTFNGKNYAAPSAS